VPQRIMYEGQSVGKDVAEKAFKIAEQFLDVLKLGNRHIIRFDSTMDFRNRKR
jgi:hypothetical protein